MNYEKLLQAILDIAEEMLVCGAEVARVEDSIARMCTAYGCTRINSFIITSNIQVTFEDPEGSIVTQIRRIVRSEVNFDRLDYLNDLSRYICREKPSLSELIRKYDEVMGRKSLPVWIEYAGAVMIASGFTVFFGGNMYDAVSAAVLGIIITGLMALLGKIEDNQMAKVFMVSVAAGFVPLL